MHEIFTAISDFVTASEGARLEYIIGGSVCSGVHSIIRNTNDVDIVVSRSITKTDKVIDLLKSKFIVDEIALEQSHAAGKCFNIFHEETAIKFDLFPAINEFHATQLARGVTVQPASSVQPFRIASVEDIIVAKLNWLQQSGSERQRNDIATLVSVNKNKIDTTYVKKWAAYLGVPSQLIQLMGL